MTHLKPKELIVVVPVYNEAGILKTFIQDWKELLTQLNIDFVIRFYNDGSTDQSGKILDEIAESDSAVEVIHKANTGHGSTLIQAYNEALNANWVFQIDSDHELDHYTFTSLWNDRNAYDVLLGERIKEKETGSFRKLLSAFSSLSVHLFFGGVIKDSNSPYRLMRSDILHKSVKTISSNCFAPNVLLSAVFANSNRKVKVFPVKQVIRKPRKGTGFSTVMFMGACNTFFHLLWLRIKLSCK